MPRELSVMDLFAGCGGLTNGFADSGLFRPVAAVERDVHAAATYAQNFGDHVFVGDVAEWSRGPVPEVDVVVGGPPCQGFSALGRQQPNDPRNGAWRDYVSVLTRARPSVFVLENVPQFLKTRQFAQLTWQTLLGAALEDYRIEAHVLRADHYRVPQRRRRAVVIGHRLGGRPLGAPPVSGVTSNLGDAFPSWLDARVSAIEPPDRWLRFRGERVPGPFKLPELHATREHSDLSLARYRAIPPGGSRWDLPDELSTPGWRRHKTGAGDVMGRLMWDKPAVTIRTEFFKPEKGRFLHPDEDRPITHAEAALIQGFPEDFVWCGTRASIARQIGNAVPPPLARALAVHIAEALT